MRDTLYLEKDLQTKYLSGDMVYMETDDGPCLLTFQNYRLLKYAYPSGKLLEAQTFEKEGPDGIGTFVSGNLITQNALFLISNFNQVVQTDLEGNVLNRFLLPEADEVRLSANYSSMNGNKMYLDEENKLLYLYDVPFVLKEQNLAYRDWGLKLDLENGTLEHIAFRYPDQYRSFLDDPELGPYSAALMPGSDLHLVSFPASDSVLVIDPNKQYWMDGSSSRPLQFLRGTTEPEGDMILFKPNYESGRYKWWMKDPFQKVFFRLVILGTKTDGDGTYYLYSLIQFNSELNRVAEYFFDSREFGTTGFATAKGFYLPLAIQESDDEVAFARFGFKPK